MAAVAVWRLFAFMDGDEDGVHDESRMVAEWQLDDVLRWCRTRGYDHVYLTRLPETARFEKRPAPAGITHHA